MFLGMLTTRSDDKKLFGVDLPVRNYFFDIRITQTGDFFLSVFGMPAAVAAIISGLASYGIVAVSAIVAGVAATISIRYFFHPDPAELEARAIKTDALLEKTKIRLKVEMDKNKTLQDVVSSEYFKHEETKRISDRYRAEAQDTKKTLSALSHGYLMMKAALDNAGLELNQQPVRREQ